MSFRYFHGSWNHNNFCTTFVCADYKNVAGTTELLNKARKSLDINGAEQTDKKIIPQK